MNEVMKKLKRIVLENPSCNLFDSLTSEDRAYNRGYVDGYSDGCDIIRYPIIHFERIIESLGSTDDGGYGEGFYTGLYFAKDYLEFLLEENCKND